MEYESTQKLFKSAAMRRLFMDEVMVALEACQSHVELICVYQGFEPTFKKMEEGEEYDQMTLDIINVRYQGLHKRHEEDREYIQRALQEYEERKLAE